MSKDTNISSGGPAAYWLSEYRCDDDLNEEIWSTSPTVQRLVQKPQTLTADGCFGAQQAMIDGTTALPWPPDLLGSDWSKPGSLLIIGSAYAGFITEFSGRPASMALRDYDPGLSYWKFQEKFLNCVVARDRGYYYGLATLLQNVQPAKRIAVFDLCRASFVRRRRLNGQKDVQGDIKAVRAGANVYSRYVEDPERTEPTEWLWRRVISSRASAIVVLGSIAEHGFLRLARRRGLGIEIVGEGAIEIHTELNEGRWVAKYALDCVEPPSNPEILRQFNNQKMRFWLQNGGRWYSVFGQVDGIPRKWFVLPVFHPASMNARDPQYQSSIRVLRRMLEACC
jgi:uracil-DNA glycosylase